MSEKVLVREGIFTEVPDGTALLANRCKSCGKVYFPNAPNCLNCFHEELEEIPISRQGTLLTYTVVQMPSTHFQPPYAVGYVDLPEGVRIFAPLDIIEEKPFQVGMAVKLYTDTLWREGEKEVVGYRFTPL